MEGGLQHAHIAKVRWVNNSTGFTDQSTRAQMVEWIEQGGQAYVSDGVNAAWIGVVQHTPKYIRTYADRTWTDNLLALPKF